MKGSRQGISKLTTAKEKIKAYLIGDDITLTGDDLIILSRWEKVDLLYRKNITFEEIIKTLVDEFNVSRFTAQNDIYSAMEIFSAARKVNKKYILYLKYEQQMQDVHKYREMIFNRTEWVQELKQFVKVPPDSKEIMALAKLEESATYTMNSMPVEVEKSPFTPTKVVLHLVEEDEVPMQLPLNEALKLADSYLKSLPELQAETVKNEQPGADK